MKRIIKQGIILFSAVALGSCSTSKLASNQSVKNDDVYYSEAKAGDTPEPPKPKIQDQYQYDDDDYYYYDDYASRINRFNYYSPFGYYNDLYYGYSPYDYGYGGWGFGFGYGYYPYGYYPYGYYPPYAYAGIGYPIYPNNGYPTANRARPYTGPGFPARVYASGGARMGYSGLSSGLSYAAGRAAVNYGGRPANYGIGRPSAISRGGTGSHSGNVSYSGRPSRPSSDGGRQASVDRSSQPSYSPPSSSSSSSSSSGSSGGSRGGGGGGGSSSGGGRPGRP